MSMSEKYTVNDVEISPSGVARIWIHGHVSTKDKNRFVPGYYCYRHKLIDEFNHNNDNTSSYNRNLRAMKKQSKKPVTENQIMYDNEFIHVQHFYSLESSKNEYGKSRLRTGLIGTLAIVLDKKANLLAISTSRVHPLDFGKGTKNRGYNQSVKKALRAIKQYKTKGVKNPPDIEDLGIYSYDGDYVIDDVCSERNYSPSGLVLFNLQKSFARTHLYERWPDLNNALYNGECLQGTVMKEMFERLSGLPSNTVLTVTELNSILKNLSY